MYARSLRAAGLRDEGIHIHHKNMYLTVYLVVQYKFSKYTKCVIMCIMFEIVCISYYSYQLARSYFPTLQYIRLCHTYVDN